MMEKARSDIKKGQVRWTGYSQPGGYAVDFSVVEAVG